MTKLQVAIIQTPPIPLAIGDGITAACSDAAKAIADGAQLVAFGETYLGGYPIWLDEAPGAALWDHPGTKALHRIMLEQAVRADDARFAPLQTLADQSGALISIGAHERNRTSLYNTQFLFRPNLPPLLHRKLVPTHGERLIWGRGDGSTMEVHSESWGNVGSLICWEHWMPLARAAMHNLSEAVHIAAWPTVREIHGVASRHYAFEGRCFVLAAGLVQHRQDMLDGLKRVGGDAEAEALLRSIPDGQLNVGNSMMIAPDTRILAQGGRGGEVLHAVLDLDEIGAGLTAFDGDGHYSRPDVFELSVNNRELPGVKFENWAV